MTLRVGLIGAGAMGAGHATTLATGVPAARVVAVHDPDAGRAEAVAGPLGARPAATPGELIADADAVIVASPDFTHADLVLACLAAGRPVLCEKPLAETAADARKIVEAEQAGGRRLVQVGFMRRYDPGYLALKAVLAAGVAGEPLIVHNVHRNPVNHTSVSDAGIVTGSMIHELDVVPWLLDTEVTSIRIESPRLTGVKDPQLAWLRLASGAMATIEVFVNAGYGYDVRCEVVGSRGTAQLPARPGVVTSVDGATGTPVGRDFVAHFTDAYRAELTRWAAAAADGTAEGPSAWDGYVANAVAEAGIASLASGTTQPVAPGDRPAFYR
ncbi:Gfo/Idh/MocA family oxidoreductase [Cryptosporangium phraense]|uniref:Inositol 2-dehydrogenase n=1 Tax=Cryptosporangium phraense TaxID=2593070 RepID=A0A545AVZ9_9ACTN|nr:Gfo/Idh/MocA family oxidoreductase [Cryptosporangium phraense]TQS44775.1 inositol 2-dehydrogenase [Cryptosporangium phraense]